MLLKDDQKVIQITKVHFNKLDTDGSGYLELNEIAAALNKICDDVQADRPSENEI